MKNKTVKAYTEQLKQLQGDHDTEVAHIKADDILTEVLKRLGYHELVDEYEKVKKWYA